MSNKLKIANSSKVAKKSTTKTNETGYMKKITNYLPSWVSMHYPTIKPNNKNHPDIIKNKNKNKTSYGPENHFVYLIQEREFLKSGEPVYKIGKTTQLPNSRLAGYPKNSRVIYYLDVTFSGCHYMEKKLILEFDRLYIQRSDIGRESYEGNIENMKATFLRIVKNTDHLEEISHNPVGSLFWKLCVYSWRFIIR